MSMRFRPVRPADFGTCRRILEQWNRAAYNDAVWSAMPRLWETLWRSRQIGMSIWEDETLSGPQAVRGFGAAVFVSDEFADSLSCRRPMDVVNDLYQSVLEGRSPVLSFPRVREANSGAGLNLLLLETPVFTRDIKSAEALPVLQAGHQAFHFDFDGYRMRSIHRPVRTPVEVEYSLMAGFRLRELSYPNMTQGHEDGFLLGLTDKEALESPGSVMSLLFYPNKPRFFFTQAQQDVLIHALFNRSDDEIAEELKITPHTVKKHWREILNRVGLVKPHWFRENGHGEGDGKRGLEKRRHLLEYVRNHLEELRPLIKSE